MYNPEKLEEYTQKIYSRYEYFNNYTLETIARRIKATGRLSAADQQALKNIADITGDMNAITKKLAEITRMNVKDIEKIYTQVITDGVNTYKPLYDFKGMRFVPFEQNEFAQQLVKNWAKQTAETMLNLSRTKALCFDKTDIYGNVTGSTPLDGAFENAISEAVQAVSGGTTDFNTAMSKTVERLGGSGVKVTYGSGVNRSLSAMIRQNILYAAKQSAQAYGEYIGNKLGCDGFEVDAHSGCRPSHEFMQGKIYSYNGKKVIDDVVYEDGAEALTALNDYGCLHFKTDVILGVSAPRYSREELERIHKETTELIEYHGKKKTLYEWKQVQRNAERNIRTEMQKANMFEKSGMNIKADGCVAKAKAYRIKYDDMCSNIKGLQPHPERMSAYNSICSGKVVDNSDKSGIIKNIRQEQGVQDVRYIGNIDSKIFESEFGTLKTSEVVLTDEREEHIKIQHPNDFELFEQNCEEIIKNPHLVVKDEKNENTVFMIRQIENTNLNIVLKIVTLDDEKHPKNSIMTAYRIRNKNVKKLEKKNKVLYKYE